MRVDYSKAKYFNTATGEMVSGEIEESIRSFLAAENEYTLAIREITALLEKLNDEFKATMDRNLIHQVKTRVKTPESIIEKLIRRGFEVSLESAREHLDDIAGVRVICPYISDVYLISGLLLSQNNINLIRQTDYIKQPKPNGYRSLHLIVTVPVVLSHGVEMVKVEIQFRSIAMDFWATIEHDLVYKLPAGKTREVVNELKECAEIIAQTDLRMQKLRDLITTNNGYRK